MPPRPRRGRGIGRLTKKQRISREQASTSASVNEQLNAEDVNDEHLNEYLPLAPVTEPINVDVNESLISAPPVNEQIIVENENVYLTSASLIEQPNIINENVVNEVVVSEQNLQFRHFQDEFENDLKNLQFHQCDNCC